MMKRRSLVICLAAIVALASVAAASRAAPSSRSATHATIPQLTVGLTYTAATVDPKTAEGCNNDVCGLFMEHLLEFGPNGKLEPMLATSVSTPNPVTYIYHLRHGVKFWDGNEMTSADVMNSIKWVSTPDSVTSVYFKDIKSMTAPDKYTVKIVLKQPDADWKNSLSYEAPIFEKAFQDAHKATMGNPGVLIQATGPWKLDSFNPTTGYELSANPNWWGGKVPVDHISAKVFSTETSEALAMRAGEIDIAFPSDGAVFTKTAGATVSSYATPAVNYLAMNANVAPWSDIHVRRAIAYALNRSDIIDAVGGPSIAVPADVPVPQGQLERLGSPAQVTAALKSVPTYAYNVTKAKAEMAQSKYPNGVSATTDVLANFSNYSDVVQVIAAELKPIGINLTVKVVPSGTFFSELSKGAKSGIIFGGLGAVSPDPSILLSYMLGSKATYNAARYMPPAIDTMLAKGLSETSNTKRLAIYTQILKQIQTDLPYVSLYRRKSFIATNGKFTLPPLATYQGFLPWALDVKAKG
jgi:peptide/nickel transport system substrate-binding protein